MSECDLFVMRNRYKKYSLTIIWSVINNKQSPCTSPPITRCVNIKSYDLAATHLRGKYISTKVMLNWSSIQLASQRHTTNGSLKMQASTYAEGCPTKDRNKNSTKHNKLACVRAYYNYKHFLTTSEGISHHRVALASIPLKRWLAITTTRAMIRTSR